MPKTYFDEDSPNNFTTEDENGDRREATDDEIETTVTTWQAYQQDGETNVESSNS